MTLDRLMKVTTLVIIYTFSLYDIKKTMKVVNRLK